MPWFCQTPSQLYSITFVPTLLQPVFKYACRRGLKLGISLYVPTALSQVHPKTTFLLSVLGSQEKLEMNKFTWWSFVSNLIFCSALSGSKILSYIARCCVSANWYRLRSKSLLKIHANMHARHCHLFQRPNCPNKIVLLSPRIVLLLLNMKCVSWQTAFRPLFYTVYILILLDAKYLRPSRRLLIKVLRDSLSSTVFQNRTSKVL